MASADVTFLREFLADRQEMYGRGLDLHESELLPDQNPDAPPTTSPEAERAARLAESVGLDGNTFRALLPEGEEWTVAGARRDLKKQIRLLPEVIANLENPGPALIPEQAELLGVREVATMLNIGESTVRANDRKGLLPAPVRIGGTLMWPRKELQDWIKADCPPRERWAARKGR